MSPVFPDSLQLWGPQPASLQGWLPWVFLPGLLWTLWRGERRLLWLGSALLLLIFALGPAQRWGDRVWLLPGYPLWAWVPGYGRMMHPDRWVSLAGLFLVLGAVDGLARWRAWACLLLPAGLVAQLFLLGNAPLGTWRFHAGQLWQRLAQDGDGAIITVPVMRSAITCAWQPWHGRPTLGGMVEDQPQMLDPDYVRWVESNGLLVDLFQLGQGQDQPLVLYQSELDQLHSAGFDTVLLHQASWAKLREARGLDIEARLSAALGPPWYQDEEGVIWRLPRQGRSGQRPGDREPLQLNGPPGEDPGASGGPRRSAPGGAPPPAGPR
jgi:hypothetical protein